MRGTATRRPLPVRAIYTASSLARFSGVSRARFQRMLEVVGVRTLKVDSVVWVPLVEIERKLDVLWESILLGARLTREEVNEEIDRFEK